MQRHNLSGDHVPIVIAAVAVLASVDASYVNSVLLRVDGGGTVASGQVSLV